MAIAIRGATGADLAQLPGIEADAARVFKEHGWGKLAEAPCCSEADFHFAMERGVLLVAETAGGLAGFAMVWQVGECAHLRELDVARAQQGLGVGKALLHGVADWAASAGLACVTLTTFREVPWNAPFYARNGFAAFAPEEACPELRELLTTELSHATEEHPRVAMRRMVSPV